MNALNGIFVNKIDYQEEKIYDIDPKSYVKVRFDSWVVKIYSSGDKWIDLHFKVMEGKFKGEEVCYECHLSLTNFKHLPSDLFFAINYLLKRNVKVGEIINLRDLLKKWCKAKIFNFPVKKNLTLPYILHVLPL
ncbi:MAG: hypothetical protein ACD_24C00526G0001 [uncultured bacterium]|nr:MAG: hypothetical protein ACD_24C00526G0001 [uncultured bacterium]